MIFEGNKVEVFELNGEVLFNPYDCGKCLELKESAVRMAISKMNDNQVKKLTNSKVKDIDFRKLHNTGENFLTESGVYKLIFKSRKESAERFQDWVTDEVLPTIRKHGAYMTEDTIEKALTNPDFLIQLATKLKEERELRIKAENERMRLIHQGKLYTATEIAKELGFTSARKLNADLKDKKIQYTSNGTWVLTAKYSDRNFTSIKQHELESGKIIYDRKWTGLGRDFLLDLYGVENNGN